MDEQTQAQTQPHHDASSRLSTVVTITAQNQKIAVAKHLEHCHDSFSLETRIYDSKHPPIHLQIRVSKAYNMAMFDIYNGKLEEHDGKPHLTN
ncbi:hypothetical protein U1Q18_012656 [Sarracenia purpurea var. burkii]